MAAFSARLAVSLPAYGDFPGRGLPQLALAGRSNVGKSSLINTLCGMKGLARTSSTPGKTALINIYELDGRLHLVDLPGYGYARVSREEKRRWGEMIDGYFAGSGELVGVLHLVDIRHEPSADDLTMGAYLQQTGLPRLTVAVKADKVSRAARGRQLMRIGRALAVQPYDIIAFSSLSGEGREALLKAMEELMSKGEEARTVLPKA